MQLSFDAAAVTIMLSNMPQAAKDRALAALADKAAVALGEQCPECGCRSIEDNGMLGRWVEYRCASCDCRFGPGAEA